MNEEEPTSEDTMEIETSHEPNADAIVDRLQTKDMIGARQHIRSMLFSKLKDRLDGINSASAPLPQEQIEESGKVTSYESVEQGGWSLGSLDDIKGTGKAKKPLQMMTNIREKIVKQGSKFVILSKDGSKKLGEYDNEEDAKKRLRQIEFFKRNN